MDPSTHGIRGLASVFGNLDEHNTIVDPGAFAREVAALRGGRLLALASRHKIIRDPSTESSGVVSYLEETGDGLYFESIADATQEGRDALARVDSGSSSDSSFSFREVRGYTEMGRRVVVRSPMYFGPFWERGGHDVWGEYSQRGEAGSHEFRIVLPTSKAMSMLRSAEKSKDFLDVMGTPPIGVRTIRHLTDLSIREITISPPRFGSNPRAYAEVFDLAEAKSFDTDAAQSAAGQQIADAIAAAAQEIAS